MNFLNSWLQGIVVAVVVATIIQMIMPNGNNKKYIKVVIGIYILFSIVSPIIDKFSNSKFEISSIIDTDKYKTKTYETSSTNIEEINKNTIKEVYISNLKNDIKEKVENKNFIVEKINLNVEESQDYTIKNISIDVRKEEDSNNKEEINLENKLLINEIEKIKIQIGETIEQNADKKDISQYDKENLKTYLADEYGIKKENIDIY